MKRKSIWVQVLTAVIMAIGAFGGMFGATGQAWLSIISMAATLVLSTFLASGVQTKDWTIAMWATNTGAIILQLIAALGDSALIDPKILGIAMVAVNLAIQFLTKDFSQEPAK